MARTPAFLSCISPRLLTALALLIAAHRSRFPIALKLLKNRQATQATPGFADAIRARTRIAENKHAVNGAIILFTQHPHYLCYFTL